MPSLTIRHVTTYRYRKPVAFGEHRMMLRPRDSHDQKVIAASLHSTSTFTYTPLANGTDVVTLTATTTGTGGSTVVLGSTSVEVPIGQAANAVTLAGTNRTFFTGPISVTNNNQFINGANLAMFAGVVSGTGSINLVSGTLAMLNSSNTYSGGTNVGGGNLQVNSSDTVNVANGGVTNGPLGTGAVNLTGGIVDQEGSMRSTASILVLGLFVACDKTVPTPAGTTLVDVPAISKLTPEIGNGGWVAVNTTWAMARVWSGPIATGLAPVKSTVAMVPETVTDTWALVPVRKLW